MFRLRNLIFIIAIIMLAGCGNTTNVEGSKAPHEQHEIKPLNHATAEDLLENFSAKLNVAVDDQMKVRDFSSKEELFQSFANVAKPEAAEDYYGYLFTEEKNGLYLLAAETPVAVNLDEDYELKRMDSTHYQLFQEGANDLYGNYQITVDFVYENNQWLIEKIDSQYGM